MCFLLLNFAIVFCNLHKNVFILFLFLFWVAGDVIYNSEYPAAPPDFIFGPDDEDFMPCSTTIAPVDSLLDKALSEWNNQDSTLLLVLIQGLRFVSLKTPLSPWHFFFFLLFTHD